MQGLPSSADQCAASSLAPLENFGHLRRIDRQTHRHAMSALAPKADIARRYWHVRLVPILLQKALMASAKSDSVAQMRFAAEASDDGAAQPRPRTAILFILS